jgi:hypothetical protein
MAGPDSSWEPIPPAGPALDVTADTPETACFAGCLSHVWIEAMNITTQNSSQIFEDLKTRKAHLTAVLKLVDTGTKKNTMQKLTITAIKAEMGFIEHKLKNRK